MGPRVIISDFGGVLTNPLEEAFLRFQADSGVPLEELGKAMFAIAERDGENPLYRIEKGEITFDAFEQQIESQLTLQLGKRPDFRQFSESYFDALSPNQPFLDYLFEYKSAGGRLALLTNNIREWEPRWRAMLPIDELFETVVDSGFVGMRKPEREIYELTFERIQGLDGLADVEPAQCVLVDDIEVNCDGAREFGFGAVRYHGAVESIVAQLTELR